MGKRTDADLLPGVSPAGLEEMLFHLLRTFYQFEQIEVNMFGLSYELIYILKLLKRVRHVTISEIAEEMKIKVFTATRLVDQLEKRNLIKRERECRDKRCVRVKITASGTRMVKRIEKHALDLISGNMSGFTKNEIAILFKAFKKIDRILGIEPGIYNFKFPDI